MVFWALEQRRKWAQEREAATQARVDAARAEMQTQVLSEFLAAGIVKPDPDLEQWAQQNGIELRQLPPYWAARARQRRRERRAQRRQSAE